MNSSRIESNLSDGCESPVADSVSWPEDDDRLNVLYSPFREKEVNPKSWDSKLKFWTNVLMQDFKNTGELKFDTKTLPHRFKRKQKVPSCLGTVLQELMRQGKIMAVQDFEARCQPMGWIAWSVNSFVKKPIWWTVGTVTGSISQVKDGEYILVDLHKEMCDKILAKVQDRAQNKATDYVLEWTEFKSLSEDVCKDDSSLNLILLQLIKDKKAQIMEQDNRKKLIKFIQKGGRSASPVSEVDLGVLRLRETESHLREEVERLASDMKRCVQDAKYYLSKGLKNSAKNALRRKKATESSLTKKENALETVQSLLQKIQDADSDKMIVEAYEAGISALKLKHGKDDISVSRVDDIMDALQEEYEREEDISMALAQGPSDPSLNISQSELEAELDAILSADGDVGGDALATQLGGLNLDLDLPSVPSFDPIFSGCSDENKQDPTFTAEDKDVTINKKPLLTS